MTAGLRSLAKTGVLLLYPWSWLYDGWRGLSSSHPRTLASRSGRFTSFERTVIEAVVCHIVPTDDGPGAHEADAVGYIETASDAAPALHLRYRRGVAWLEYAAQKCFRRSFLALTVGQQRQILVQLDLRGQSPFEQGRLALFYHDLPMAREFFWTVRRHAFEAFYMSATGREVLGFGPPIQTPEDTATPPSLPARHP